MKKRILIVLAASVLSVGLLAGCSNNNSETTATATTGGEDAATEATAPEDETSADEDAQLEIIRIGATPSPHAEILEVANELLEEKGYTLDIVEFVDYVQPNLALDGGDLDANYFQHLPYLEQFNDERGLTLVSAASIHYEPFAIYAGKTASIEALADGAKISVPNDSTNEARALLLLEAEGLIKLKEGVGLEATVLDIVENEKKLDIIEIEAAQLPISLPDVDLAVINGNYAIGAGLSITDDAIAFEDSQSIGATTYGNVIAVRDGDEESAAIQALIEVLTSDELKSFIEEKYEGAVVPLF